MLFSALLCELFIRPFLYKATPTNFQFDLDEENQRSHFGALTMCHGIGSFAASSTSGCDARTYSTRIMPFFVCHSDHIPFALQNSYRHHSVPFQDGSNDKTSHVNNAAQVYVHGHVALSCGALVALSQR